MIIKWLNQHPQLRNTAFWTSVVSVVAMFVIKIASLFGYQIETIVGQYQEQVMYVIGLAITILGVFLSPPQSQQTDENNSQNQSL